MQRTHVLVVDDDASLRDLLRTVCTMAGFEVASASDGAEALGILLQAEEPWIVLLDVSMPHMTGPEVCAHLMAAGGVAARHLVLLMTAGNFPDADPPTPAWVVLRKPFDLSDLLDIMDRMDRAARPESDADGEHPDGAVRLDVIGGGDLAA